ncbi:helix-turn-helix domain-containing protein [Sphingobacterium sp. HMA12]|uniref:winged helix-turn-helix transcriptional regulator n=1 Tax=Sphingobacterium sp. HMA12 TaxID=2050894 RepID=UPI000CEA35E8|nr:helix-turn-helix domain-containing protein [Sphingobacterium sp. HMA12]
MNKDKIQEQNTLCRSRILGIKDTTDVLSGKWKIFILGSLLVMGKMRFMELLNTIDGIGRKMLAKELDDLEINGLISRTELKTKPLTVVYELTELGKTLKNLINEVIEWGEKYRDHSLKQFHNP